MDAVNEQRPLSSLSQTVSLLPAHVTLAFKPVRWTSCKLTHNGKWSGATLRDLKMS